MQNPLSYVSVQQSSLARTVNTPNALARLLQLDTKVIDGIWETTASSDSLVDLCGWLWNQLQISTLLPMLTQH